MRIAPLIFLLLVLVLVSCATEPEMIPITRIVTQISQVEVTTVVEITREVNVTRIVESAVTTTFTPTLTPIPPNTPRPTPTATTAEPIIEVAEIETPSPFCIPSPPADWAQHVIELGDSLSKYSTQHEITIAQIQQINCLSGIVIREGNALWLPITVTPTPSPSPTPLPQQPPSGSSSGSSSDSSSDSPKPPPKPTATPP